MKKIILTTAIILTAFVGAFAQEKTATADLSVTINPIQTIAVLSPTVNLNYSTNEDYKDGVTQKQENHLKVYSTGAFQVKVLASDLEAPNVTEKIPASGIKVTASNGSENPLAQFTSLGAIPLPTGTSTNASTIFTSTQGGVDRNVNITYQGAGGDAYINKYFKAGGDKNVYKTIVTYSIEAM